MRFLIYMLKLIIFLFVFQLKKIKVPYYNNLSYLLKIIIIDILIILNDIINSIG